MSVFITIATNFTKSSYIYTLRIGCNLYFLLFSSGDEENGIVDVLPKHLKHHERMPLHENPENVFERSSLPANSFSLFLHQNFVPFFSTIEEVSQILNKFTDADILQSDWSVSYFLLFS